MYYGLSWKITPEVTLIILHLLCVSISKKTNMYITPLKNFIVCEVLVFINVLLYYIFFLYLPNRDDNGARRGRRMRSSSPSRMVLSCPIPASSRMAGKTLSPHPRPLGPREAPSHSIKLYFLLICSTTSTIFLMKPMSLIKIYLKLQLNLSHQIK